MNFGNVVTANASTVNILSGASITTSFFCVGRDGSGIAVINGGFLSTADLRIGYGALVDNLGSGTFILNSGTVIAPLVDSATITTSPSNVFQLNGGVLQTSQIVLDSGATSSPFAFTMNGGTIVVSAGGTLFNKGGSSNPSYHRWHGRPRRAYQAWFRHLDSQRL
jgi:hypothetical protein